MCIVEIERCGTGELVVAADEMQSVNVVHVDVVCAVGIPVLSALRSRPCLVYDPPAYNVQKKDAPTREPIRPVPPSDPCVGSCGVGGSS